MANQTGGGSHLAGLAARRASLQKSRERLGLSGAGGVGAPVAAQSNVRAAAPTPESPAAPPQAPQTAPVTTPSQPQRDPQMLAQAQQFLDQVRNKGNVPTPIGESVQTAPPSVPEALSQQVDRVGAAGMSPEMQAFRIFGRPPAAREMVIFNAVRALEQQLGRPPTRNELLLYVTRPGSLSSGPEPAI